MGKVDYRETDSDCNTAQTGEGRYARHDTTWRTWPKGEQADDGHTYDRQYRRWQRSSRAYGPVTLTEGEANETLGHKAPRGLIAGQPATPTGGRMLQATDAVNRCMAEALQRQGFVMKSELNPDGHKPSWNLQNATATDSGDSEAEGASMVR